MKYCLMLISMLLATNVFASSWTADEVKEIITNVNDTWQKNHPKQERSFWDPAVYHTGNMEAYALMTSATVKA